MNSTHPFDLVIGLDRSDRNADLYRIDPLSGKTEKQSIATSLAAASERMRPSHRRPLAGQQMAADHLEMLAEPHPLSGATLRSRLEKSRQPFGGAVGGHRTRKIPLQKSPEENLKNLLPDYLRGELSYSRRQRADDWNDDVMTVSAVRTETRSGC